MPLNRYGTVYLVGAGPGDPNLLTKRAQRLIENADIILYDRLVNPFILQYAKPDIEIIDVGKKPYTKHIQQEAINQKMIEAASKHHHVVRLKGGDPAIFGRVQEEVEALVELNINFEIVPGITSASAAAQSMNLGLTMRSIAKNVTFSTGHFKDSKDNDIDISTLINKGTLAVYMGVKRLPRIISQIRQYTSYDYPIAIVFRASLFDEQVLTGNISNIEQKLNQYKVEGLPGICIIGDIISYSQPQIKTKNKEKIYIVKGDRNQALEKCELLYEQGYGCIIEVDETYHYSQQALYKSVLKQYTHQFIEL
ncbi:uroporphyrinogen-III C-methyltransferase [Staphylococcus warneri]|uniref:uroporphyrinogen-III C-methyltransferase n=1 Tax=Staphylococcus warneri TaxID=1292 RepID=UPI00031361F2|nr:uroporphyrinogen-III C-methyltransferase [Staphylococcus warneri]